MLAMRTSLLVFGMALLATMPLAILHAMMHAHGTQGQPRLPRPYKRQSHMIYRVQCCGLGHRLARNAMAYKYAMRTNSTNTLYVDWGVCEDHEPGRQRPTRVDIFGTVFADVGNIRSFRRTASIPEYAELEAQAASVMVNNVEQVSRLVDFEDVQLTQHASLTTAALGSGIRPWVLSVSAGSTAFILHGQRCFGLLG